MADATVAVVVVLNLSRTPRPSSVRDAWRNGRPMAVSPSPLVAWRPTPLATGVPTHRSCGRPTTACPLNQTSRPLDLARQKASRRRRVLFRRSTNDQLAGPSSGISATMRF